MKKTGMTLLLALSFAVVCGAIQPAFCAGSPSRAEASPSGVRVTFVGNCGFLISVDGKKVLIDAMFAGFPGGYELPKDVREALVNARPPFDDVNLILVTHNHGDHFDAPIVRQYLKNNPKARLVSTAQVTGQLTDFGDRVTPLTATKGEPAQTDVEGIHVKAVYLSHGTLPPGQEETINYGYVVTVNGLTLFHTGDADPKLIDMSVPLSPEKPIDLAFISHFYFNDDPFSRKYVREWINGKYDFPIHYAYTTPPFNRAKIKSFYPDAVLFDKEMDSWDMAKK